MIFGHNIFLVLLLVCQIVGLTLFLRGFFPLKQAIQGRASNENLPSEPSVQNTGHPMTQKFGRVVIVLIDALRADFVFNEQSTMPFTQDLIKNNKTFSFLAKAHPPTVTMPRIKALTTGGIPGFIDVVLNVDSKSLQEDNLISQMKFADKKLVFYGDDTWVKLFPGHFLRTDGTTSFLVTDYTEVDDNVTRHLDEELSSEDWDVMILHYLGLDHIGHIAGPSSPLVGPKLLEMDHILKDIYTSIQRWDQQRETPSLLVLCGDHGMSDAGSHGGASSAETNTPLVFVSTLFEHHGGEVYSRKEVQQIDLAPTLSLLLGLPIPQNSLGIVIAELFSFHGPREMLRALQLNAHQLSQVLTANGHTVDNIWELQHAHKLHSDWLKSTINQTAKYLEIWAGKVAKQYILALQEMSGHVTASLSTYDLHAMICGIAVLVQTLFWVVRGLHQLSSYQKTKEGWPNLSATSVFVGSGAVLLVAVLHLSACSSTTLGGSDILCSSTSSESVYLGLVFTLLSAVTLTATVLFCCGDSSSTRASLPLSSLFCGSTSKLLVAGVSWHTFSLLSSSFVEEEHQTWYFLTSSYFITFLFEKAALFHGTKKSHVESHKETCSDQFESPENKLPQRVGKDNFINHDNEHTNSQFHKDDNCSLNSVKLNDNPSQTIHSNAEEPSSGNPDLWKRTGGCNSDETTPNCTLKELLTCALVVLVLLAFGRLSRAWNQTGIKWSDRPDLGDWLVKPENKTSLSGLFFVSLLVIIGFRHNRHGIFTSVLFVVGAASAYGYRTVTASILLPWIPNEPITKGITEARYTYYCVAAMVIWSIINVFKSDSNSESKGKDFFSYTSRMGRSLEILLSSLLLLEILLQRPHNVALLAVFVIQEHFLSSLLWKSQEQTWIVVLTSLWMGHAMYFTQGNSNSLATVDIAAGYVGLKGHVTSVVGPLMIVATYCGPLLWLLAAVLSIVRKARDVVRLRTSLHQACYVITLCHILVLCVYCTLVFGQRYHLFVWSVFSPKLLYEAMKTFVFSTCVILLLGLTQFVGRNRGLSDEKSHQ